MVMTDSFREVRLIVVVNNTLAHEESFGQPPDVARPLFDHNGGNV
jgi:hypothetical protein